jgi:hypothetical protein
MAPPQRIVIFVAGLVAAVSLLIVGVLVFDGSLIGQRHHVGVLPTPAKAHHIRTGKCVSLHEGDDLHKAIDGTDRTAFCIHAGTYDIGGTPLRPGMGDRLMGDQGVMGPHGAILAVSKIVYSGSASIAAVVEAGPDLSVNWLDISGAKGSAACQPGCGRGIGGGVALRVSFTRLHDNAIAGAGGIGSQSRFAHVEVDHNGSTFAEGCCAAGIKSVADGLFVVHSYIHDNIGNGLWSDLCSDHFLVSNNLIDSNSRSGVQWETSSICPNAATRSAVIHSNIISHNNVEQINNIGGIHIRNSENANIYDNTFGGSGMGKAIAIQASSGYSVTNTKIHNNVLNGDFIGGCSTSGVSCRENTS